MLFSSLTFLYYFLPCMLIVYFTVPQRFKNAVLLLGSLLFYAWGEPEYVFLMIGIIVLAYGCGLLVEAFRHTRAGRFVLLVSVGGVLSFLLYYKYAGFFLQNIEALTGIRFSMAYPVLPAGISFYTFQAVSYLADVHRGEAAQHRLVQLAVYLAMFPQLIAGPIVRYGDIAVQLEHREHSWDLAASGIRRFLYGMAKKILLANQLGELCSVFRGTQERSVLFCWLYAVSFMLFLYFDFSGYSDMAIGLGRIFGFRFLENFRDPYSSDSITEFWRRWHISLGLWFRDYVYIPMGGGRAGKGRQIINLSVVWMLTGLWHGAGWNFAVWGLYFALLLTAEKLWLLAVWKHHPVLARCSTLMFVMIGFVIFDAPNLAWAWEAIGALFGAWNIPLVSAQAWYCLKSYGTVLLLAVACSSPAVRNCCKQILLAAKTQWIKKSRTTQASLAEEAPAGGVLELLGMAALLLFMTSYLVDGSFQPFLYFRF